MKLAVVLLLSLSSVAFADQVCPDIYRCTAYEDNFAVQADGLSIQDAQDQALDLFSESKTPQNVKFACVKVERYFAWAGCFER